MKNKIIITVLALLMLSPITVRASSRFTVEKVVGANAYEKVADHTDPNKALSDLYSRTGGDFVLKDTQGKSSTKIVAMNRGLAASYPMRRGVVGATAPAETLNIYKNSNQTGERTYITYHYKMNYYKTAYVGGSFVAEVEVSGFRGWVDVHKIDLIPMQYVESAWNITLGGNEDFYNNPEASFTMVVKPDYYIVTKNSNYNVNELSFHYSWAYKAPDSSLREYSVSNYTRAESWMSVGTKYYSADGVNFFTDVGLTKKVGTPSYAYFQYLPLRTKSLYTAEHFDAWLKNEGYSTSVMHGNGKAFVESGKKYGMNPVVVYAMAGLESAYGTSFLAKDRYNLFGWNAFDSNPGEATSYEGVSKAVNDHMSLNLKGYMNIDDWRFGNYSVGNKGAGANRMYASDPYWGMKIGALAYRFDRSYGGKEYNLYSLGQIKDNQDLNARATASPSGSVVYTTPTGKKAQIIPLLEKSGAFYKTTKYNGENLDGDYVYMSSDYISIVNGAAPNNPSWTESKPPVEPEKPQEELGPKKDYIVAAGAAGSLRLRDKPSANGEYLTSMPNDTIVSGQKTANGWVKITYAGKTGYASGDFLKEYAAPKPPEPGKDYQLGDINNDGKISTLDIMMARRYVAKIDKFTDAQFKAADVSKDGKITTLDIMMMRRHVAGIELIR